MSQPLFAVSPKDRIGDSSFEDIRAVDNEGNEFWFARDLMVVLEYTEWRNFTNVIDKAKEACRNSGIEVNYHFVDVNKTIEMPKTAEKNIADILLSRYACYLIVQNGDPRKDIIAKAQTYFALQTRKQEIVENEDAIEDQRRLDLRQSVRGFNHKLAEAAKNAGVVNYGVFQNYGYRGLYGGETAGDIKKRKGLEKKEDILDHMGSTELAANYFRITQTEEKIKKDRIKNEAKANSVHYEVGKKVRQTMIEISGTLPEDLPTPDESIKQVEAKKRKLLKNK